MGMLNIQPRIDDDYSAEVIRLARERSPAIDAWIVEQRYLNEVTEDSLSPLWFRNRCTIMLCEELADMGIVVNQDFDDVCDHPDMVYSVSMLRSKFDDEKLFDLFKSHRDLFDLIVSEQNTDAFEIIIDWTRDNLPLDEGWQLISDTLDDNPGVFESDDKFVERLQIIIDRVESLGEPDVTDEVNQETVDKFINFLSRRQKYIMDVVEMIWVKPSSSEEQQQTRRNTMSRIIFGGFEKELGSKSCIASNAREFEGIDLIDDEKVCAFLDKIRKPYLKKWKHCLEYYFGEDKKDIDTKNLILMYVTMIVDTPRSCVPESQIAQKLQTYEEYLGTETVKVLTALFADIAKKINALPEFKYYEAE